MKNLNKLILFVFVFALSIIPLATNLSAQEKIDEIDNYQIGQTVVLDINAQEVVSNQNAIALNISTSGIKITNFTRTDSQEFVSIISTCSESADFTETNVCIALASPNAIAKNTNLGQIEFEIVSEEYSIVDNSEYSNGGETKTLMLTLLTSQSINVNNSNTEDKKDTNYFTSDNTSLFSPTNLSIGSIFAVTFLLIAVFMLLAIKNKLTKENVKRIISVYSMILLLLFFAFTWSVIQNDSGVDDSSASGNVTNGNTCTITSDCQSGLTCVNRSTTVVDLKCTNGDSWSFCSQDSDCDSGLKCVNWRVNDKRCTSLTNNNSCDKTTKQCANGLKCVNRDTTTEGYECSNGLVGSSCAATSDCQNGLTCVNSSGTLKKCSNLNNNSSCDKTSKICNSGLKCVSNSVNGDNFKCSNGTNSSFCSQDSDCNTGLKCVNWGFNEKKCSDLLNSSVCDKNLKQCASGLKCVNRVNTGEAYVCSNGDNTSKCSVDSDCDSGLSCVNFYASEKMCSDLKAGSSCDKTKKICSVGFSCLNVNSTGEDYKCVIQTVTPVICGSMDNNSDLKIDLVDLSAFVKVWQKSCTDTPPTSGCGPKDSDKNGKIDLMDFAKLASKWFPTKQKNCNI